MTTRRIWAVLGNGQKLDGGAMFGNAPKALWSRWMSCDEDNRVDLACRALLIEERPAAGEAGVDDGDGAGDGVRRILLETGVGAFFPPKLRERFGVTDARHVLLDNLAALGLSDADIDVVVLSHLHFDHAGGLLSAYESGVPARLLFPNATYVVSDAAWRRALAPHRRDRASFIEALHPLLEASGRLEIVAGDRSEALGPAYALHRSEGHTPGLLLVEIPSADGAIVFAGDLVPGQPWLHAAITMGYDRYPERLIDEKSALLADLATRNGRLFFTHDPDMALVRVGRDERGRFCATETWAAPAGLSIL